MDNPDWLVDEFSKLDDADIFASLKVWADHPDRILSLLSEGLINRNLPGIRISKIPWDPDEIEDLRKVAIKKHGYTAHEAEYLVFSDIITNNTYAENDDQILFFDNNGELVPLPEASDIINVPLLNKADNKYFLCYPKWLFSTSHTNDGN